MLGQNCRGHTAAHGSHGQAHHGMNRAAAQKPPSKKRRWGPWCEEERKIRLFYQTAGRGLVFIDWLTEAEAKDKTKDLQRELPEGSKIWTVRLR